jgi:hypothetical protein
VAFVSRPAEMGFAEDDHVIQALAADLRRNSFRLLSPLLTSALRSGRLAATSVPKIRDAAQTSRGKTDRLHRTPAGFTTPTFDDLAAGAASLSIPALRVGDPYPPRKRRALRNTPNLRRSSFAFKITPGKRVPTAFQPIREHKHEP